MLKSIYIKNFAIIDELRVDFEAGFNVFTGETGAGKSIIVGALQFLKGGRADASFVRKGTNKAIIEGVFSLDDNIKQLLDEEEIEYDDELIVYRTLSSESKNTIRVNNRTVSLSFLNTLLNDEIDIHSQKESQYLLNSHNHLRLLDRYMNNDALINEVKEAYLKYQALVNEYDDYSKTYDNENDIEYYKYQINEIDEANLKVGEEEELEIIEKRAKSSQKIIDKLNNAISLYSENGGIDEKLYNAVKELNIDDEEIAVIYDRLYSKYYEIEDCFNGLKRVLNNYDISEDEINRVQERLFTLNRIKRKYKLDITSIINYRDDLVKRIEAYENRQYYIDDYLKRINLAKEAYLNLANNLSNERKKAAISLENAVKKEVDGLELKYFDFQISLSNKTESINGIDDCSFLICTNKGEELKPLIKVASGGEMSRIMLGLKAVFTKLMGVSMVVFDEIDTGVSGKAALAIGLKMAKIAKYNQVLSITHLAQVASFADNHYYVSKNIVDDRTVSSINQIENDKRIKELAIMATSSDSDGAIEVAKELLVTANEYKKSL